MIPALRAFISGEPDDLAGRTERHREFDGLVDVLPDADVRVEAFEGDVIETDARQHVTDEVRPRHGKRTWTAVDLIRVVMLDDRHDLANTQLRFVQPWIVLAPPPHDHRELAAEDLETGKGGVWDREALQVCGQYLLLDAVFRLWTYAESFPSEDMHIRNLLCIF